MSEPDMPILLALYEPDIAQNAGAMMRTCACLGVDAAVIEPAGFRMADSRFRRAGMDYLDAVRIVSHDSWGKFEAGRRLVLLTTKGETNLWDFAFAPGDVVLVGRESAGVPPSVAVAANARIRIPMLPALRSLNVGVAAAIALAEALRQLGRLPPANAIGK
jgi:tRNA (cytidine/uridine-2'-O-)-methyltransferase